MLYAEVLHYNVTCIAHVCVCVTAAGAFHKTQTDIVEARRVNAMCINLWLVARVRHLSRSSLSRYYIADQVFSKRKLLSLPLYIFHTFDSLIYSYLYVHAIVKSVVQFVKKNTRMSKIRTYWDLLFFILVYH